MTPNERDLVMMRLMAAWPRPLVAAETVMIWHEHLGPLDYPAAIRAVNRLEKTKNRQPALSDFHEAYAAEARGTPSHAVAAKDCGLCENGFVDLEPDSPNPAHLLARCPNGCMPRTFDQNERRWFEHDRRWDDEHRARLASSGPSTSRSLDDRLSSVRDPSGPQRDDPLVF